VLTANLGAFSAGLDRAVDKIEKKFRARVIGSVNFTHSMILSRTPVHTGKSIRNYIWTVDKQYTGPQVGAAGTMPPGPTNSMSLGSEPRRPANEGRPTRSKLALDFKNPYRNFILTNVADTIKDLEYGLLPSPDRSRSPAGMFGITLQALSARIASGTI